jgi:glycosyltransferase involved in cell wall biosynthesis
VSDDVIDVVIPARNTADNIASVVRPFYNHPAIGHIIVVANPPDLRISKALNEFDYPVLLLHTGAEGKGQAVMRGLNDVQTEYVVFCDSDVIGLTEDHVSMMVSDAVAGEDSLLIGVPEYPDNLNERRLWAWPWVSGQRCVPTRLVRPLILHGYLMETQINRAARYAEYPVRLEWLKGLTSPYVMTDQRLNDMDNDARWGREHGILP